MNGKVRIFIQPLGQRGGACQLTEVRKMCEVPAAVRGISGAFDVAYYRVPSARPRRAGFVAAALGGAR